MNVFPYFSIFRKAASITRKHRFLWVFGWLVGGTFSVHFVSVFSPPVQDIPAWSELTARLKDWVNYHPNQFMALALAALAIFFILFIISAFAKGAVIWAAQQFGNEAGSGEGANFKNSLHSAKKYLWRIVGFELLISTGFFVCLLLFSFPVAYLLFLGAYGRAAVLALLALAVFMPTSLALGFLHLFGPIFIVLYNTSISDTLVLAFGLVRHKLWESVILAAVLIGLKIAFIIALIFSIIILMLPIALGILVVSFIPLPLDREFLIWAAIVFSALYGIVWSAGFTTFQNVAWVLALDYMVKTRKTEEKAEPVPAAEPVA